MTTGTVAAWLLTYLLHSTALLVAAWIGCALLGPRRLAAQETVLRVALLGGLATATLSLAVGAGGVTVDLAVPVSARLPQGTHRVAAAPLPTAVTAVPASFPEAADGVRSAAEGHAGRARALPWPAILVGLWATGALLGGTRLAVSSRRLRALLADRQPLPPGRLVRRLAAALGLRRPVRLSLSRRIAVPFAVGVHRPEVCVPERTLGDLSSTEREALIAHELAHHARRDPAWLAASRAVEAMLYVQPLNRLAVHRLQQLAECQCDDAAVRTTGRPLDLARCLVEVAHWAVAPPTAVAALSSRTGLGRRVERLIAAASPERPTSRWLAPCLAVAVASLGVLLPGVDLGAARPATAAVTVAATLDNPPEAPPPAPPTPAPAKPAPKVEAHPAPAPRPVAAPAPAARPAPPVPPDPELERLEDELDRLVERVTERVERHRLELEHLEQAIETMSERLEPHAEELERLGEELGRLAERHLATAEDLVSPEIEADLERRMHELGKQIREKAATFKPSTEEIERLAAEARALAEASRPSPEELEELKSLARELAERAGALAPDAEEARELAREVRERARAEVEAHRAEIEREARESRERARAEAEAHREEFERQVREERLRARELAEAERDAEQERRRAEELERQAEEQLRQEAETRPTPTPTGGGS